MVLGLPASLGGNTAKPDCGTHTQNLDVSTSGKTTLLSFNLQETGQGLW